MKSNIFLPKIINVGFQKRTDTYTSKLAYVIYYDETGKLRKETSWQRWRDKTIPNEEFENVPTSGFVLNKKVGDYSGDWGNHRQAYCRIYDPRNFEFEITVENLLYILENANSIKGKGLEGEFVYGWDGKDLLLMPVEAPDYKRIKEFNKIVHNNESIKAKDLIIGATYLTKDNHELVYMGKFDYYSYGYKWEENGECRTSKNWEDVHNHYVPYENIDYLYGKYLWFAYKYFNYDYVDGEKVYGDKYEWRFEQYRSIPKNKIITCIDDKCMADYADIYERMEKTCNFSPRDHGRDKYIPYTFAEFKQYAKMESDMWSYDTNSFFTDSCFRYKIYRDNNTGLWTVNQDSYNKDNYDDFYSRFNFKEVKDDRYYSWDKKTKKEIVPMTIEELYEKLKPCYREIYLANGNLYERECYYKDEK